MALDLSTLLGAVRTSIEALTPVTDTGTGFRVVEDYPAASWQDIPASVAHRAVMLEVVESEPLHHLSGAKTIWRLTVEVTLVQHWGRNNRLAETIRRSNDAHQIAECFRNQRPGEAAGVRGWTDVSVGAPTTADQRRATVIRATCTAGLTAVVT